MSITQFPSNSPLFVLIRAMSPRVTAHDAAPGLERVNLEDFPDGGPHLLRGRLGVAALDRIFDHGASCVQIGHCRRNQSTIIS
jgi:hypothetical protein